MAGELKPDTAFNLWMAKVNSALYIRCGMGADDLPDYTYRDAFDNGDKPDAVANRVIKQAKGY